jgi:DNA modification methylase
MIADPPYNIGFNYASIDDEMPPQEYADFCRQWFELGSKGAIGSIVTPGPKNERLYPQPRDKGIWLKRYASAGASCFNLRCCEPIMFYGKFAKKRNFDWFDYSSGFTEELREAQRASRVEEQHPPAKPADLWTDLIDMLADGIVFDPFSGNGTTLMCCEKAGRVSRVMEIYPAYVAVALERWSQVTGRTPELVNQEGV